MYFASGSKCALSTPLTSGELAGRKLVLLIALHSSRVVLGKDGLSLTGRGGKREREKRGRSGGDCAKVRGKKDRHRPLL